MTDQQIKAYLFWIAVIVAIYLVAKIPKASAKTAAKMPVFTVLGLSREVKLLSRSAECAPEAFFAGKTGC